MSKVLINPKRNRSKAEKLCSLALALASLEKRPKDCHYSWNAAYLYLEGLAIEHKGRDQTVLDILQRAREEVKADLEFVKVLVVRAVKLSITEWGEECHHQICAVLPQALLRLCGVAPDIPSHVEYLERIDYALTRILEGHWYASSDESDPPKMWFLWLVRDAQPRFEKLRRLLLAKVMEYQDQDLVDGFIRKTIQAIEERVQQDDDSE